MTLQINPEKMKTALTMDMLATDIADYLVRRGVSGDTAMGSGSPLQPALPFSFYNPGPRFAAAHAESSGSLCS